MTQTLNNDNCRCINNIYFKKPKLKLQSETTSKFFHKPLPIEKNAQYQMPKPQQKHYDPELLKSSYKTHFQKVNISEQSTQPLKPNLTQDYLDRKSKAPFYSDTSYKDSYKPNPIIVEKQPVYEYKPKDTKFQGQSSYKADFVNKKNTDLINTGSNIVNVQSYLDKKPKIPFEGSSAYKQTFKPHQVKVEKQPQFQYKKNPQKFEGQSSYKQAFKQLPKEAYKSDLEYCPVHPGKIAMK